VTQAFGPETCWLALRTNDPEIVRAALGFTALEPVPFDEGLSRSRRGRALFARERAAFVAPPIDEWTLVVVEAPVSEIVALAERAGSMASEVQAFVCRARARHYAWLLIVDGKLERAFERLGERTLRDEGAPQRGEPGDTARVDESQLLELAGTWSVDPSTLGRKGGIDSGWLGRWPGAELRGPGWGDVLGGALGGLGLIAIEIGAILALGRLFARTPFWWLGAAAGVLMILVSSASRERWKPRRVLLLAGVALALGAVLGGAFPLRQE
jgi:hypothetical protein